MFWIRRFRDILFFKKNPDKIKQNNQPNKPSKNPKPNKKNCEEKSKIIFQGYEKAPKRSKNINKIIQSSDDSLQLQFPFPRHKKKLSKHLFSVNHRIKNQ